MDGDCRLEEQAALCTRIAHRMRKQGLTGAAERFVAQATDSRQRAAVLRQVLVAGPTEVEDAGATPGPVPRGPDGGAPTPTEGEPDA